MIYSGQTVRAVLSTSNVHVPTTFGGRPARGMQVSSWLRGKTGSQKPRSQGESNSGAAGEVVPRAVPPAQNVPGQPGSGPEGQWGLENKEQSWALTSSWAEGGSGLSATRQIFLGAPSQAPQLQIQRLPSPSPDGADTGPEPKLLKIHSDPWGRRMDSPPPCPGCWIPRSQAGPAPRPPPQAALEHSLCIQDTSPLASWRCL